MSAKLLYFFPILALVWTAPGCSKQAPELPILQYRELVVRGDEQLNDQHFDRALELYLKARPLAAEDPSIHFRIAKAARGSGKSDVGMLAIKELVRLAPKAEQDREVLEMRTAFSSQQITKASTGADRFSSQPASPAATNVPPAEARQRAGSTNPERTAYDTLTTRELIIADASGSPRMVLNTDSAGGLIKILNKQGAVAMQLEVADNGGAITIRDNQERPAVEVAVNKRSSGYIKGLNGAGNKALWSVGTDNKGDGLLSIADKEGNDGVQLGIVDAGFVTVRNKQGQAVAQVAANTSGAGLVKTANAAGKDLIVLGTDRGGDGALSLNDKQGREAFGVRVSDVGNGIVAVHDSSGKALVTLGAFGGDKGFIEIGDGRGNTLIQIDGQKRRIWSAEYPGSSTGKTWPSE